MKSGEKTRDLIQKSVRSFYLYVGGYVVLPLVVFLGFYLFLANSYYYLSIEASRIVVRAGHPQWKFLRGFDRVVVETDFTVDDLDPDPKIRAEIFREQATGFWFEHAEGGYQAWGEQLVARLAVVSQARALRWLGQPQRAVEILIRYITDPQADSFLRRSAAAALGQLAQTNPQAVTPEVIQVLSDIVTDPQADPDLRYRAAYALGPLGQANPQAVTPEVIQVLSAIVTDPQAHYLLRGSAAYALGPLGQANPQAVTPEVINVLSALVTSNALVPLRLDAAFALGQLGPANPQAVTPNVLQALSTIVGIQEASFVRYDVADALGQLGQANPQAVTPDVLQALSAFVTDPRGDA